MTLEELREQIAEGWKVRIIDHDYGSEGRDDCEIREVEKGGFVIVPKKPWSSQGVKFTFRHFIWETTNELVADGLKIHVYVMPTAITSRSTPGVRRLSKTYVFTPPRGY